MSHLDPLRGTAALGAQQAADRLRGLRYREGVDGQQRGGRRVGAALRVGHGRDLLGFALVALLGQLAAHLVGLVPLVDRVHGEAEGCDGEHHDRGQRADQVGHRTALLRGAPGGAFVEEQLELRREQLAVLLLEFLRDLQVALARKQRGVPIRLPGLSAVQEPLPCRSPRRDRRRGVGRPARARQRRGG
ncbi:hypothetical protein KGA66_19020 [Actinocrinis puniceicyclus]|uniref:Uncharacterized protein n=1 Tax=Actinocrinis puniceicyclus TaxID=977794 RepID=A0A8J7WR69_9ACTN|nr:hypothetical protein [Actinocrinis puniceicyclus]MBS2965150.1 hypothetical protein [Actinocrinis puniceicyclus]